MSNEKFILKPNPLRGESDFVTFSIRIDKNVVKRLDQLGFQYNYSRNCLINIFLRNALDAFVQE